MKRVAALDLLRGLAAFSVAIPHYLTLNATDAPVAEVLAVTAVEVFFVLSGFVLAPQILTQVVGQPAENLRVFLVRRWMRIIPPYLVALFCVSYVTGQLQTVDFVRYVFYVQNLFFQANVNDYYPVAWSLSVGEWFYVTFAPLVFITARLAYLSCLVVLSSVFWIYFEKPILAARPKYRARADSETQAGLVSPA